MKHFIFIFLSLSIFSCTQSPGPSPLPKLEEAPAVETSPPKSIPALEKTVVKPDAILELAGNSKCAEHQWKSGEVLAKSYFQETALSFASAVCNPKRPDVLALSAKASGDAKKDGLTIYKKEFEDLGMFVSQEGALAVRETFTLVIGAKLPCVKSCASALAVRENALRFPSIQNKTAEILPKCVAMLYDVELLISENPELCESFK